MTPQDSAPPPSGAAQAARDPTPSREHSLLRDLNLLLVRALKALGDAGETDRACRIAADAWALMRHDHAHEAERLNGALHHLTRPRRPSTKESIMQNSTILDVRELPPIRRHALIFDSVARLPLGHGIVLVNDHDPKPLYYQFEAETPGQFGWEYVEAGPQVWRVLITRRKAA